MWGCSAFDVRCETLEAQGQCRRRLGSLVGKAMAASKGKANPAQVNTILKRKLGG